MVRATDGYVSSAEAARRVGVSKCTLLRACHRGDLRVAHHTPGGQFRFAATDLDAYAQGLQGHPRTSADEAPRPDVAAGFTRLAALPADTPPARLADDLLTLLAESLAVGVVLVARLDGAALVVDRVHDRGDVGLRTGLDLGGAYGTQILSAPHPLVVPDTRTDPRFAALAATHVLGLGAYTSVPLRYADGQPYGALCTLHPAPRAVSAQEMALLTLAGRTLMQALEQEAARAREEQMARAAATRAAEFATVLDHLPCGVIAVDARGRVTFINEQGRQVGGHAVDRAQPLDTQAPAYAIRPLDAGDSAHADRMLSPSETPIARALAGEVVAARRSVVRLPGDATDRVLETAAVPLRDGTGGVHGAVALFSDITDRVQTEQALQHSEARFRLLYERAPIGVVLLDRDGYTLMANPAFERVLGYSEDELRSMTFADATRPQDVATSQALFAEILAGTRDVYTLDKPYLHKDGHLVWCQLALAVTRDAHGAPQSIIATLLDVSAHRAADERLRHSEERYRRIVETAQEGIWQVDADGCTTFVNQAMAEMLGYTVDEMQGRSVFAFVPPDEVAAARTRLANRRQGVVERTEVCYRHKDGRTVQAAISANAVYTADGAYLGAVGLVTDITERKRMEQELRTSEERFRALTEHATDLISVVDADGTIRYASPSYQPVLGYAPAEVVGQRLFTIMHPADVPAVRAALETVSATANAAGTASFRLQRRDGAWRTMDAVAVNRLADPAVGGIIATTRDITERRQAEETRARLAAIVASSDDAIIGKTLDGTITSWNAGAERLYGYSAAEVIGRSIALLVPPAARDELEAILARLRHGEAVSQVETVRRHKDGHTLAVSLTISPVRDAGGHLIGAATIARDITARKRAEEQLQHLAWHDALTGLPNRLLLEQRLSHLLAEARQTGGALAVVLVGLDRFKEVNDTFGHQQGDRLLQQVAERLRATLYAGDLLARLEGDEFAIVLPGATATAATRVAQALGAAFEAPFHVEEQALYLTLSSGIALAGEQAAEASTLLRQADVALGAAKQDHRAYAVYDAARDDHTVERVQLLAELRAAIATGGLALHYQPQVAVGSGQVCGVEALVRWPHAERGLIPPDQFIPLAEQSGLIAPLTAWVLVEAVQQARRWQRAGRHLSVAVNLSMWDVHDTALPERVARLLREADLPPAALRLEVTEGTLMADPARTVAVLERLHALGVGLAVDDFGTGYSSLAYLKRLPVDELKIDKGFVRQLSTDGADAAIVASTVGLGHALGLRVVAEGVEDRAGWDQLAELGCDVAQGYYLSRPLSAAALEDWLRDAPWATA